MLPLCCPLLLVLQNAILQSSGASSSFTSLLLSTPTFSYLKSNLLIKMSLVMNSLWHIKLDKLSADLKCFFIYTHVGADEWWWSGLGSRRGGGDVLPYLDMVGRFRGDDPPFLDFQSDWVPILYLNTIRLTLSFCRKSRFVSSTFSSRDTRT